MTKTFNKILALFLLLISSTGLNAKDFYYSWISPEKIENTNLQLLQVTVNELSNGIITKIDINQHGYIMYEAENPISKEFLANVLNVSTSDDIYELGSFKNVEVQEDEIFITLQFQEGTNESQLEKFGLHAVQHLPGVVLNYKVSDGKIILVAALGIAPSNLKTVISDNRLALSENDIL